MKSAVPLVFASCSLFPPFLITVSITSPPPMYNALNPVPLTVPQHNSPKFNVV